MNMADVKKGDLILATSTVYHFLHKIEKGKIYLVDGIFENSGEVAFIKVRTAPDFWNIEYFDIEEV